MAIPMPNGRRDRRDLSKLGLDKLVSQNVLPSGVTPSTLPPGVATVLPFQSVVEPKPKFSWAIAGLRAWSR